MKNSVEILTANPVFSTTTNLTKVQSGDCDNDGQLKIARLAPENVYIAMSGCQSLAQSFGYTFIELVMVENDGFAV